VWDEVVGVTDETSRLVPAPFNWPESAGVNCTRCGRPATNHYEGADEYLDLCDDCLSGLGDWLRSVGSEAHPLDATHKTVWMSRKDVAFLLHSLFDVRQRESLSEVSSTQIADSIKLLEKSLKQRGNDGDE
jgi:hypothetical protein